MTPSTDTGRHPAAPGTGLAQRPNRVLAVLLAAGVTFSLSQTLVLPALPVIAERYSASEGAASWILTGFLLSASVATPVVGKLGDRYGKASVLTAVLLVFSVGAVVNALATDISVLIAGRVLQGVAGGVFPLAFGIVRDAFPAARIPGALSTISAILGVGAGVGLPLSGVLIDRLDVSWIFWLGLIALPVALAVRRWVPASPPVEPVGIDWPGAGLLAGTLGLVLLGVTQAPQWGWGSGRTLGAIALGLALGAAWLWVEAHRRDPLIRLDVLTQPTVAAANLTALLVGFALFSGLLLVSQLAQVPSETGFGFGASTTVAGLLLLPSALTQVLVGSFTGRLAAIVGFRVTLVVGAGFCALAYTQLALLHAERWHLVLGGLILGVGIALAFASLANLVVDSVAQSEVGIATGINTVLRTVGGAFGSAVSTAVLAGTAGAGGAPTATGFTVAFVVSAAAAVVATASAAVGALRT